MFVENDIVKMEWDAKNWLATKARAGKPSVFILAAQEYKNSEGKIIPVYFNAHTAFIWETEDYGIWDVPTLKSWCKDNADGNFPTEYDCYHPVIDWGGESCNEDVLEKYGLLEHKADIENRMADLVPFGIERDAF